jgi:uncharacterized protein YbjT (DUF2867 family)
MLREQGESVRVLSRHGGADEPGIHHVRGDTMRDIGLDEAFRGVPVVLHLAGGSKGDDVAARHVTRAARESGVGHLVLISVVGADRMPIAYFRDKAAAEQTFVTSGVPFSILRAAQLHGFIHRAAGPLARSPLVPVPRGMRLEPVDAEEVSRVLVDLALGEPSGSVPDLAGPEVLDVDQVLTPLLAIRGSHRPRWHLRIPGAIGRAYRSGENLAAADARRSGVTWSDYLAARLASEGRV